MISGLLCQETEVNPTTDICLICREDLGELEKENGNRVKSLKSFFGCNCEPKICLESFKQLILRSKAECLCPQCRQPITLKSFLDNNCRGDIEKSTEELLQGKIKVLSLSGGFNYKVASKEIKK